MTDPMKRADLFPTCVYQTEVAEAARVNKALLAAIANARALDKQGIEKSNFTKLGGWHSHVQLHKDPEFAHLGQIVRCCASELAQDQGYDPAIRLDINAMWAIVNAPGASNQAHIHPGSLWSGVYYIQAEQDAGAIEFTDPRTANLMRQPVYEKRPEHAYASVRYQPVPGRLLIFPSWLFHAVRPNLSESERIIISFNLTVAGQ